MSENTTCPNTLPETTSISFRDAPLLSLIFPDNLTDLSAEQLRELVQEIAQTRVPTTFQARLNRSASAVKVESPSKTAQRAGALAASLDLDDDEPQTQPI